MALSINTYFIQMVGDIGLCPVKQMTDKLHVVQGNDDKLPQVPSIALGAKGLSPLTMATAYAAFANRGSYCSAVAIESITGADGKKLAVPKSACSQAMSQRTADSINTLLRGVIDSGTGKEAGLANRDNAGKTGTTDGRYNAWFVGYTPNLSGAVWVGSALQNVHMTDITIGGEYHPEVFGSDTPGPIWKDAMTGALEGQPAPPFTTVDIPDAPKPGDKGTPAGDGGRPGGGRHGGKPGGHGGQNGDGGSVGGGDNGGGGNGQDGGQGGGNFPGGFSLPPGFPGGGDQNGGGGGGGNFP
jgi:membrane peptidoglycan carboxypeptidase